MTDIVERLRACHGIQSGDPDCCCLEAAAEIERLKKLYMRDCTILDAEIERLRAKLKEKP